jgi:hypothetical protein
MPFKPPVVELDRLKMFFGDPYEVNVESAVGRFYLYQPTIGDILSLGEKKFYQTLNVFITNTTACRLMLWEMGIDWCEFKDYHLFLMLFNQINPDAASLIFRDFDITTFEVMKKTTDNGEELSLYNHELEIEINEEVYYIVSQYLQNCFNIFPERKITSNPVLKQWYINKDKRELENNKKLEESGKKKDTSIQSVISACINHPGFKYKLKELRDVGVCEFYDSVKRLQVYESSTALMKGMYSGFIDAKSISPDAYNFMKDI